MQTKHEELCKHKTITVHHNSNSIIDSIRNFQVETSAPCQPFSEARVQAETSVLVAELHSALSFPYSINIQGNTTRQLGLPQLISCIPSTHSLLWTLAYFFCLS